MSTKVLKRMLTQLAKDMVPYIVMVIIGVPLWWIWSRLPQSTVALCGAAVFVFIVIGAVYLVVDSFRQRWHKARREVDCERNAR